MKQALLEIRKEKEELEIQLGSLQKRNKELEKENADTSNKYLRLYDENDKLQEVLQNL
jgi:predicted nuclease with TOPRIM domain